MNIFTQNFFLKTDKNGNFSYKEKFDTSNYWPRLAPKSLKVNLYATLLSPKSTRVCNGKFDVDGSDGNPSNTTKSFELVPDEKSPIGKFKIKKGSHSMKVSGETNPQVKNADLQVKVQINLAWW